MPPLFGCPRPACSPAPTLEAQLGLPWPWGSPWFVGGGKPKQGEAESRGRGSPRVLGRCAESSGGWASCCRRGGEFPSTERLPGKTTQAHPGQPLPPRLATTYAAGGDELCWQPGVAKLVVQAQFPGCVRLQMPSSSQSSDALSLQAVHGSGASWLASAGSSCGLHCACC